MAWWPFQPSPDTMPPKAAWIILHGAWLWHLPSTGSGVFYKYTIWLRLLNVSRWLNHYNNRDDRDVKVERGMLISLHWKKAGLWIEVECLGAIFVEWFVGAGIAIATVLAVEAPVILSPPCWYTPSHRHDHLEWTSKAIDLVCLFDGFGRPKSGRGISVCLSPSCFFLRWHCDAGSTRLGQGALRLMCWHR